MTDEPVLFRTIKGEGEPVPSVVALAESLLRGAKKGEVVAVSAAIVLRNGQIATRYAIGSAANPATLVGAIERGKWGIFRDHEDYSISDDPEVL